MMRAAVAALLLLSVDAAHAATLNVTPNGSSSSACTPGSPCSIQHAADIVNPGDVVLVGDGTYTTGASNYLLTVTRGGTASSKVTFRAANRWAAKLSGSAGASSYGVRIEADNVRLEGFDIADFNDIGVYNASGNFFELVGNHIHHIGRTVCSADNIGRDGYYSQGMNDVLMEGNVFNDIGRLLLGENGCGVSLENNDHAVYISGSRLTIRNNIFYNIRAGWCLQFYPSPSSDVSVYANTFSGSIQQAGIQGQIVIWPTCTNMHIVDNIFSQVRGPVIHMGNSSSTGEFRNNLTDVSIPSVFDVAQPGFTISGGLLNVNPKFASVQSSGGVISGTPDFHLLTGSAAIDAGLSLTGVTTDFDGSPRPQGSGFDIGCFEFKIGGADGTRPARVSDLRAM